MIRIYFSYVLIKINKMLVQKKLNAKGLINFPMRYFKIKMKLDRNNIQITKNPMFTKVSILNGGEINLKNKTFIFGKLHTNT